MSFSKNKFFFISTVVLLLALSVILYLHMKRLIQSTEVVNNTRIIQLKLEQTVSNLREAETAQRGFLLTNDLSFMRSKNEAKQKVYSIVRQLYKDISDSEQRKNLDTLQTLIDKRLKSIDEVLFLYQKASTNDSDNVKKLLTGEVIMDEIRSHINQMGEQQLTLLKGWEDKMQRYVFITPLLTIVLIFFSLLLLSFANYQTLKQLKISTKYLAQANDFNFQLLSKKEELERVNEELESFNYIASHDLKEPVRKIAIFCSIISADKNNKLSEESQRIFSRIKKSNDRMDQLLTDLLMYTKVSAAEKVFQSTNINEVLLQVTQILQEEISESGGTIQASDLPTINAIPSQLVQLFVNLISNALKFKKPGISPFITINSSIVTNIPPGNKEAKPTSYHRILAKDNGIGLNKEFKDKAFELFSRLHTQESYPGTGAGLTICRKIVQRHHGFIELQSEPGEGAEFQIYLPV
jgi:signal transduction histidine kinase